MLVVLQGHELLAKKLSDVPLAIVDKLCQGHNVAEVMNLIGDVKRKVAVMAGDMIDTAGTIAKGAALLHQEGAREVYACSTHAVFSPPAIERLSGLFEEVIITKTIPILEQKIFPQLMVLSVGNLLGETVWRIYDDYLHTKKNISPSIELQNLDDLSLLSFLLIVACAWRIFFVFCQVGYEPYSSLEIDCVGGWLDFQQI